MLSTAQRETSPWFCYEPLACVGGQGDTVSVLGQDKGYMVKYSPSSEGTPKDKGFYLTVYPELNPNTNSI